MKRDPFILGCFVMTIAMSLVTTFAKQPAWGNWALHHVIWLANALLLTSYILLGQNWRRAGWAISLAGNTLWLPGTLLVTPRHWDFASLSIVFTFIGLYNLIKACREYSGT